MIKIEILLLANNHIDPFQKLNALHGLNFIHLNKLFATQSLAEHGLGFMIKIYKFEDEGVESPRELLFKIIFDTGSTNKTFIHNLDIRGLSLYDVNSIVLSHWHYDHTGALYDLLKRIKKKISIICHESAQFERFFRRSQDVDSSDLANKTREEILPLLSSSKIVNQAPIDTEKIEKLNGNLILSDNSYEIYQNNNFKIAVSGEIPRTHLSEDFFNYYSLQNGLLKEDQIMDDKCLFIEDKNRVIILNGCCHSGLMNTIDYVRNLTQTKPISHIIGGFHMANASSERIAETINYLQNLEKVNNKLYLFPIHCTGSRFLEKVRRAEIPEIQAFDASVGTQFTFTF
jgi:7,8-dihydropterin-6-yl-methyl-4-(beta-D-ribofuranosyl)aminobenzene 5'-phosphate synthase